MLRVAVPFVIALCAAMPALAQEEPAPAATAAGQPAAAEPEKPAWEAIRIGLKAGATWSTLRGSLEFEDVGSVGFKGDYGFYAGMSVEIPIGPKLSLQPEGSLVRKFSELSLGVPKNVLRQKLSVAYMELPLLLKWYPGDRKGVQGNLVIGPLPSVRLGATIETRRLGEITDTDAGTRVRATDWGVLIGGGFEFAESFASLTIDLRYAHGLRNIDNTDNSDTARWSVLQALVGVTF